VRCFEGKAIIKGISDKYIKKIYIKRKIDEKINKKYAKKI
jgi:hypothetical protein